MAACGEIVSASITRFVAVAPEAALDWPEPPPFGALVAAEAHPGHGVIGLVCGVSVAPIDGAHRPMPLGLGREALRREHPHLFALGRVEFTALAVGYLADGAPEPGLSSYPPQLHDMVRLLDAAEVVAFTERLDFLRFALESHEAPADALVVACLRHAAACREAPEAFLAVAGSRLAMLLRGDYARLAALVSALD